MANRTNKIIDSDEISRSGEIFDGDGISSNDGISGGARGMLVDSHCHLHDREFYTETEALNCLSKASAVNVKKIICIGTNHDDSMAARSFAEKRPLVDPGDGIDSVRVYWTYGIHPEYASEMGQMSHLLDGINFDTGMPPIAIGEVGLDYHYEGYDRTAQIKLFERMLQLALDNELPLSFHVREAFDDFFPVVANFPGVRGVIHSFSDNKKNLRRILEKTDFYVGVNGMATYSTLPTSPLDRILLETDAPFLAPVPYKGSKNDPSHIPDIAKWLSSKLDIELTEVERVTTRNCEKLFNL